MNEQKLTVGDMLYLERHKRRLTLRAVAQQIDCSAMYVSKIENGRILPLTSGILERLAMFYELDSNEVLKMAYSEACDRQVRKPSPITGVDGYGATIAARRDTSYLRQTLQKGHI